MTHRFCFALLTTSDKHVNFSKKPECKYFVVFCISVQRNIKVRATYALGLSTTRASLKSLKSLRPACTPVQILNIMTKNEKL